MKKRIYTLVSVILVSVLYYLSISSLKGAETSQINTSTTAQDTFTNTIFNTGYNIMLKKPGLNLFSNLDSFKELNFNSIQWYDWDGSDKYGRWNEPILIQRQIDSFNSAINSVHSEELFGFYERSFLSYYCYAQRLIYEVASMNDNPSINNGFVYTQCLTDAYEIDGGRTVIHARPNVHSPGYLCKNIYENLQHSDLLNWRQSEKGLWHLKPVMKIPANTHPDTPVVRIEIIPFDGSGIIKTISIKAKNFSDTGYVDKYIELGSSNSLTIYGDNDSLPCLSEGYNEDWWNWDTQCKVDFRVYWYGSCEVWFDKMIVDDERADYLFDTSKQGEIDFRIQQEVSSFASTLGNYSFFVDEVLISQVPCMKYVFEKMRLNPDVKISIATTDNLHIRSLRNDDLPYTIFYDSLHPDFIQHDAHKLEKYANDMTGMIASVLPNTIPVTDRDPLINSSFFQDVNTYNERLQNQSLGYKGKDVGNNEQGSFLYEIYKHYDSKPSTSNTKFIMQPQIHGYLTKETTDQYYWGGLREPTNEEIQVQAAISIAHGAKGICWYIYGSELDSSTSSSKTMNGYEPFLNPSSNIKKYLYTYALLNTDYTHRHRNSYGQDKWEYVSQMNAKINNWIPVLENTNWQEGFSVHHGGQTMNIY